MSWSIENAGESEPKLGEAVRKAAENNILMFCASNDQGNQDNNRPYPASYPGTFYIGGATEWGHKNEITQPEVDYTVPGNYTKPDNLSAGPKNMKGSSIATARCAGLAALILQCILYCKDESTKRQTRNYKSMRNIFDHLQQNKYIQLASILKVEPDSNAMDYEEGMLEQVSRRLVTYSEV